MRSFFRPSAFSREVSLALLVLRIVAGLAFMFHGWGKIQTPFGWMGPESTTPAFFQGLAALSEFGGGLAWILGLLTRLASLGIASTMAVAVWTHAIVRGDPFIGQPSSYELALVYFCIALLFVVAGPGRYSADQKVFG